MKTRAFITMTLAVDLDQVPGMCHQPEDFKNILENSLLGIQHYDPVLTVHKTQTHPYQWNDETSQYIRPKCEITVKTELKS